MDTQELFYRRLLETCESLTIYYDGDTQFLMTINSFKYAMSLEYLRNLDRFGDTYQAFWTSIDTLDKFAADIRLSRMGLFEFLRPWLLETFRARIKLDTPPKRPTGL